MEFSSKNHQEINAFVSWVTLIYFLYKGKHDVIN